MRRLQICNCAARLWLAPLIHWTLRNENGNALVSRNDIGEGKGARAECFEFPDYALSGHVQLEGLESGHVEVFRAAVDIHNTIHRAIKGVTKRTIGLCPL